MNQGSIVVNKAYLAALVIQQVFHGYFGSSVIVNGNVITSYSIHYTKLYEGERYGKSMVHDFNCGTVAWTDWNILLDEKGGPNHVGNMCFSPVHADLSKGELIYTNSYYYIGHFSKFIKPGAKRISCSSNRDVLQSTAFKNPDGSVIVVVMNASEKEMPYRIWIEGKAVEINSLAHSIQTLVL